MNRLQRDLKGGMRYEDSQRRRCDNAISKVRSQRMLLLGKRGVQFDNVEENDSVGENNDSECSGDSWKDANQVGIKRRNQKFSTVQCNAIVRGYDVYMGLHDPVLEQLYSKSAQIKDWRRLFVCDAASLDAYHDNGAQDQVINEYNGCDEDSLQAGSTHSDALLRFLTLSSVDLRKHVHLLCVYTQLLSLPYNLALNMLLCPFSSVQPELSASEDEMASLLRGLDMQEEPADVIPTLDHMYKQSLGKGCQYKDRTFTAFVDWQWQNLAKTVRGKMYIAGSGYTNTGVLPKYDQDTSCGNYTTSNMDLYQIQGLEAAVVLESEQYSIFQSYFGNRLKSIQTHLTVLLNEHKVANVALLRSVGSSEVFASLQALSPDQVPIHALMLFSQARKYGSVTPAHCLMPHRGAIASAYLHSQLETHLDGENKENSTSVMIDKGRCIPFASYYFGSMLPLLIALCGHTQLPADSRAKCLQLITHASAETGVCMVLLPLLPKLLRCLQGLDNDAVALASMHTYALRAIGNILREPGVLRYLYGCSSHELPVFQSEQYIHSMIEQYKAVDKDGPDVLRPMYIPDSSRVGTNGLPDGRHRKDLLYVSYRAHPNPFQIAGPGPATAPTVSMEDLQATVAQVIHKHVSSGNPIVLHEALWVATVVFVRSRTGICDEEGPCRKDSSNQTQLDLIQVLARILEDYSFNNDSSHHGNSEVNIEEMNDTSSLEKSERKNTQKKNNNSIMIPSSVKKTHISNNGLRLQITRTASKVTPEVYLKAIELQSTVLLQDESILIRIQNNVEQSLSQTNKVREQTGVLEGILRGLPVIESASDQLRPIVQWLRQVVLLPHNVLYLPHVRQLQSRTWSTDISKNATFHLTTVADAALYLRNNMTDAGVHPLELAESLQLGHLLSKLYTMQEDPVVKFQLNAQVPFIE